MSEEKCIVISTHLLEEAEHLCNRIILLNKGKVAVDGTLEKILQKYKAASLEEVFYKLTANKGDEK